MCMCVDHNIKFIYKYYWRPQRVLKVIDKDICHGTLAQLKSQASVSRLHCFLFPSEHGIVFMQFLLLSSTMGVPGGCLRDPDCKICSIPPPRYSTGGKGFAESHGNSTHSYGFKASISFYEHHDHYSRSRKARYSFYSGEGKPFRFLGLHASWAKLIKVTVQQA